MGDVNASVLFRRLVEVQGQIELLQAEALLIKSRLMAALVEVKEPQE